MLKCYTMIIIMLMLIIERAHVKHSERLVQLTSSAEAAQKEVDHLILQDLLGKAHK